MDKPQVHPVPRRPQSLASHRPVVTNPAKPAAVTASRPTPVSLTCPARSARLTSTNSAVPGLNNPARPSVPQPPASRPGPYKTSSCASTQRGACSLCCESAPDPAQASQPLSTPGFRPPTNSMEET
ncbi:hypothetical protein D623_10001847 [Myotis brandtii]|uniref:Uncharacterized protein n=1 Tax=Myotis brandtii TaxID=109478 RepID=S7MVZ8_MYOBR|nr:hypothetical protein D623_10001847 [Myotis brandtii]